MRSGHPAQLPPPLADYPSRVGPQERALLASRYAHAYGYITSQGGASRGRFFGTATCFLVITILAIINIVGFIRF